MVCTVRAVRKGKEKDVCVSRIRRYLARLRIVEQICVKITSIRRVEATMLLRWAVHTVCTYTRTYSRGCSRRRDASFDLHQLRPFSSAFSRRRRKRGLVVRRSRCISLGCYRYVHVHVYLRHLRILKGGRLSLVVVLLPAILTMLFAWRYVYV